MAPSIGRIVHYQGPGTAQVEGPGYVAPRTYPAAVVTVYPDDSTVDLFVMTHIGHMNLHAVRHSEHPEPGCWNWPPRS